MSKVLWGGEELETELEDWEGNDFPQYDGDRPRKGVYQFKLTRLEKTESTNGHPQMVAHFELSPHKLEHRLYKGYYMRDYIIVKDDGSTAFRVRPFLDALGVTSRQFKRLTEATKTDRTTNNGAEIWEITKMGPVKIPGNLLMCHIQPDKRNPDYEAIRYLPKGDSDDDTGNDSEGNEAGTDDDGTTGKPAARSSAKGRRAASKQDDDGDDDDKAPF